MATTPKTTAHTCDATDTPSAPGSNSNVDSGAQSTTNNQAEVDFSDRRRKPERKHCVGEQKMYRPCEFFDLNASPKYSTGFDSRNEGIDVAHNLNRPIPDTRTTPPDTSVKEGNNNKTDYHSGLTGPTLAAHNRYLLNRLSFDEAYASSRIENILRAAREMGFNLLPENVEIDKRDIPEWIEAQTHLRAHGD